MSKLIALSDGHGIGTAGKRTPPISELGGKVIRENEFNRAVIGYLDIELKRCGFRTLLVAPTDADTPLINRTNLANKMKADAYIAIHYDALDGRFDGAGKDPQGHTIHIYPNRPESRKLAENILMFLNNGTPQQNRGIKESNFHEVREPKMPAILSENGFMDNEKEALLMASDAFRREVAKEHAQGICRYFGQTYVPESLVLNEKLGIRVPLKLTSQVKCYNYKGILIKTFEAGQNVTAIGTAMYNGVSNWVLDVNGVKGYIDGRPSVKR